MSSEGSPSTWRKPSDIMRLRRKRKSSTTTNIRTVSESSPQSSPSTPSEPVSPSWRKPGQKRRNPFGCSPRKRTAYNNRFNVGEENESGSLLDVLSGPESEGKEQVPPGSQAGHAEDVDNAIKSYNKAEAVKDTSLEDKQNEQKAHALSGESSCAVDWSLKTKARFVSPRPFSWCTPLRTTDESAGLAAFTHTSPDTVTETVQEPGRCERSKREFQKHALYWQHPNLPWLRLCPRIVPDNKIGKPGSWVINDDIKAALMSDWSDSFVSSFNQLRGGRCPYFYVCAHAFTVLFRAGGVGGRPQLHAILSPTSRGLRESLRKEGIEFTMPLAGNLAPKSERNDLNKDASAKADSQDQANDKPDSKIENLPSEANEEDVDDDITTTEDGASSFLENLGLDAARFRSLDPTKIKLQRDTFRLIDHRPESLVLVDGSDTQALFNFLLNCRSCFASSGIQAGIPPTLLSPVPFRGATLKCLKFKTGSVRQQQTADGVSMWHSLEVEGALLPHTVHGLTRLFALTQRDYHATFSSHDASAPLNAVPADRSATCDATANADRSASCATTSGLSETGVQRPHIDSIVKECTLGRMVIRDVVCRDGLFTWTV